MSTQTPTSNAKQRKQKSNAAHPFLRIPFAITHRLVLFTYILLSHLFALFTSALAFLRTNTNKISINTTTTTTTTTIATQMQEASKKPQFPRHMAAVVHHRDFDCVSAARVVGWAVQGGSTCVTVHIVAGRLSNSTVEQFTQTLTTLQTRGCLPPLAVITVRTQHSHAHISNGQTVVVPINHGSSSPKCSGCTENPCTNSEIVIILTMDHDAIEDIVHCTQIVCKSKRSKQSPSHSPTTHQATEPETTILNSQTAQNGTVSKPVTTQSAGQKKRNEDLGVDLEFVDALINQSSPLFFGAPEIEMGLQFQSFHNLSGLAPWHSRLTEFIVAGSLKEFSRDRFDHCIAKYCRIEQRFGK